MPQALYEPLREKLKKLEEQGVIASVDEPTDWVNSLVITEKRDGSLRLCLDPKQLNKNIRTEHFQIPTFTEVSTQLGVARLFTILDQKDSYWQVELDVESSSSTRTRAVNVVSSDRLNQHGENSKSNRRQGEFIPSRLEKCGLGIIT